MYQEKGENKMGIIERRIIEYLARNPYSRSRSIAAYCHLWLCDDEYLNALHTLYKQGWINRRPFSDPANMEFYYEWYLTNDVIVI